MRKRSTQSALGYGLATLTSLFLLSACSQPIEQVAAVQVRTIETPRPSPIVPTADQLQLRDVKWTIITPENIDDVFGSLSGEAVLFAVTASGYEAIALNLSDVRTLIQQQNQIIAIYKKSYSR